MRPTNLSVLSAIAVFALSGAIAFADPLGLALPDHPSVVSNFLTVTYDADGGPSGNGLFTATGWTDVANVDENNLGIPANFGEFTLTAVIVPSTGEMLSGSLLLTGDLDNDTNYETLFESDTALQFGFDAEDLFEFVFWQESLTAFAPGRFVGIILDGREIGTFNDPQQPYFTVDFTNDEGFGGSGKSDTFLIPEPTSLFLSIALAGVALRRRRV